MRRRRVLLVAGGVIVLGVVGAAAWVLAPRGTSEVTERDAVETFRDRDTTPADDAPRSSIPEPGVYTYRGTGTEEVRLGPLPTETRTLPDEVTAIVVDAGDGCFDVTVNLFAEHTEDTRHCVDPGGAVVLDRHTKHQRIGALSPTATMTCDPATLVDPERDTTELGCRLTLDGGPASITAELRGTATVGPTETRTVGGTEVEVVPLHIAYDVTGDLTGTWVETQWLTPEHLPVRIERTLDLAGPATFTERSELDLTSLSPAT